MVFERADDVASQLAPNTRRIWAAILFCQGAAVLVPLFWLLIARLRFHVSYTAVGVLTCTILVVGLLWWLRFKGMQPAWIRSRMLAEIARSKLASSQVAPGATEDALSGAPGLQWIASQIGTDEVSAADEEQSRKEYVIQRVDHQITFYTRKMGEAAEDRRKLSRMVTVCLDGALFLAVVGVVLSLKDESERWLITNSGSDYVLAFVGAALPLIAILVQLRGSYLELNRKVGRFAQQVDFLVNTKDRIVTDGTSLDFSELVCEVERTLLGEVVEWFYQAEANEMFYRAKTSESSKLRGKAKKGGVFDRILAGFGISLGFIGRVLLGRVVVIAFSIVITTAWIHYRKAPHIPLAARDGILLRPLAADQFDCWQPGEETVEHGLLIIAHGLTDSVDLAGTGRRYHSGRKDVSLEESWEMETHWMTRMHDALKKHTGVGNPPQIWLVDWSTSANPTASMGATRLTGLLEYAGAGTGEMVENVSSIRAVGEKVGTRVGDRLADEMEAGKISRSCPMHFIGHSAGGFVVLHAALRMMERGCSPETLRITLLDTPLPRSEVIAAVAKSYPVDFYLTSDFAKGVPDDRFVAGFQRFDLDPSTDLEHRKDWSGTIDDVGPLGDHSYAHRWFINSIKKPASDPRYRTGFARSPFWRTE